jgi:hypothetical protein
MFELRLRRATSPSARTPTKGVRDGGFDSF